MGKLLRINPLLFKILLFQFLEKVLDVFVYVGLIPFQGKNIVCLLPSDSLGDILLTPGGINGNDAPFHVR